MKDNTTLKQQQGQNLWLSFFVGIGLVTVMYALLRFYPFGDGTLLTGDLNGQYVAYLADLKRRLAEGGFFYSFAKLCGGSTLGLFAYYMVSPFNLLILVLPTRMIPIAVQLMFLLRVALTSTACCWFLQKHYNSASRLLPFLSQGYGLCAFCVVYSQNIIWMDVVMLAPLLLWAVEHLINTNKHGPLLGLVFAAILLNFYTAWSVCLFSVIYFFYYWCTCETIAQKNQRVFWGRLGRFAASGILGAGLAMALLYPALLEIEETKGALFALDFTLESNFELWKLPYQLFFGNFFWSDVTNGLPNLYCGVFCVVLGLLFFLGKTSWQKKLAAAAVLTLMVLSFKLNGINLIWHGFKEPVWFPYRYSFLVSLFLVLLSAQVLLQARPRVLAFAVTAVLGLCWMLGYRATAGEEFSLMKLAVTGLVFFGTMACVWLLGTKPTGVMVAAAGFCAIAMGDMAINSYLSLRKFESYTNSEFVSFYTQSRQVVDALQKKDDSYYRIEKNFMRTLNDPMLVGYWGISHFSSTKASTAKAMLEQMGYVNYTIYGWGSTAVADSLLGIKYLYSNGTRTVPQPYQMLDLGTDLTVYENPYALPMAYVGSSTANMVNVESSTNTFVLQNQMIQSLVPGSSAPLVEATNLEFLDGQKGIKLYFEAQTDGPCYLAIPDTDNYLPADVKINGELLGEYFQGDSLGGVFPLGSFTKGQRVYLELGFEDKAEYRRQIQIYSLDETALQNAVDTIKQNAPTDLTIQEGGKISVTVEGTAQNDLLVLPFAYEDTAHWTATRNGEPVKVECIFDGMLGVALTDGKNTIEMVYHHPGSFTGIAISGVSALLVAAWYLWEQRQKANNGGTRA